MLPLRTSFASLLRRRFAAGPLAAVRGVHSSASVESVSFNVLQSKLDKNSAEYKVRKPPSPPFLSRRSHN